MRDPVECGWCWAPQPAVGQSPAGTSDPKTRKGHRSRIAQPAWRAPRTLPVACCSGARGRPRSSWSRHIFGAKGTLANPLDPHEDPLVRVGAGDQAVVFKPIVSGQPPLHRRQQWQDRRERIDAEVAIRRNSNMAALGYLEIVADNQAAGGTPLDAVDGHAQVEKGKRAHGG